MITLKSHGRKVIDIDETSVQKVLGIYADEHLADRPLFVEACNSGELSYSDLRAECDKLIIPWQLFMLNPTRLDKEIGAITRKRSAKFTRKLLASRDGDGRGVSLRIADRLMLLQEYARENVQEDNEFCGSLKALHRDKWPSAVLSHFSIDISILKSGKKEKTLDYLIGQLEAKNIRVARGVLTNKLLPAENKIRATYRKSSGFVVRDQKVPYIFLPSEINDRETAGRQIFTMLALVILIGLDRYSMYITGDFDVFIGADKTLQQAYGAVSEILFSYEESDKYKGKPITESVRDEISGKFMLTPSAVVVTLRQRGLISSDNDFQMLLDSVMTSATGPSHKRTPRIDTAVKKFCGRATNGDIIHALKTGSITPMRAQYLMFGRVDKLRFEKFKANVGI